MKLAILGHGKMGKTIERIASQRGHSIALIIDAHNNSDLNKSNLEDIDVAIDFSTPHAAYNNLMLCSSNSVNTVCGTTGWLEKYNEVVSSFKESEAGFIYASNFSIGVNLFFALNKKLAEIMSKQIEYKLSIDEIHHIHKYDSPSGTAISLANDIIDYHSKYDSWVNDMPKKTSDLPIISHREGENYGTHIVNYHSSIDNIQIKHEAMSRDGFALGAILAAEWLEGKSGIFSMNDVLEL